MKPPFRFGQFELNPATRQLLRDGTPVALGARAFDVLLALIERRERLVTKDELLELAWPGLVVEENNLQVQISTLRKLLGPQSIATVSGRGYRFAHSLESDAHASLGQVADPSHESVLDTTNPELDDVSRQIDTRGLGKIAPAAAEHLMPSGTPMARQDAKPKSWIVPLIVAGLVLTVGGGAWLWSRQEASVDRVAVKPEHPRADNKSIAVLPFTSMSDDRDAAYFADGVQEDLLTQLALLRDLKVVSRTSVAEYRNSTKNARQIGEELGVASLVEGSVRRFGNHVRVTAQLIDVRSDKHLWGNSYDRELKDIFVIQAELAAEIARALNVSLTPHEQLHLAKRPTDNLEAYDLFLRYQDLVHRSTGTVRMWSGAKDRVALLSKAVDLDPKFALAWACLATEHGLIYAVAVDRTAARQTLAKEAMARALALAPDDLHVTIELGRYYYMALRDHQSAAALYEKILQSAPHNVEALNELATVFHRFQGRDAEAVALLERVLLIDPRNIRALLLLTWQHIEFRQFERALAYHQQMIDIRPDDLDLQADYQHTAYLRSGSWTDYDRWRSKVPKDAHQKYSRFKHLDTKRAVARRDFDEALRLIDLIPEDSRGWINPARDASGSHARAVFYYAKGDRARAMENARSGIEQFTTALQSTPRDSGLWTGRSVLHAILGERGLAFEDQAKAVAAAAEQKNVFFALQVQFASPGMHALLGDREAALAELSKQLKLLGLPAHGARLDPSLASLWDDPQFKAIVNDPANNAPISFGVKNAYALVE